MPLKQEIETLRRRYQTGDNSAREALRCLLQTYVVLILRRAARSRNADSRIAEGIRRLAANLGPSRAPFQPPAVPTADDLCQRLCDELLEAPKPGASVENSFDTMRSLGRTMIGFGARA